MKPNRRCQGRHYRCWGQAKIIQPLSQLLARYSQLSTCITLALNVITDAMSWSAEPRSVEQIEWLRNVCSIK
jgi:hypothetical protein